LAEASFLLAETCFNMAEGHFLLAEMCFYFATGWKSGSAGRRREIGHLDVFSVIIA
jgi:hypothetical protein